MHSSNQKSDGVVNESEPLNTLGATPLSWRCLNNPPHLDTLQDCSTVLVYAIARTDTIIDKLASASSSNLPGPNDSSLLWISIGAIAVAVRPIKENSLEEANTHATLLRSTKVTTQFAQFDAMVQRLCCETNALPVRYGMQLSLSDLQAVILSRSDLFLTQLDSIKDYCEMAIRWLLPTETVQKQSSSDECDADRKHASHIAKTLPSKGSAYLVQKAARSKLLNRSKILAEESGSALQEHFQRFDGPNPIKAIRVNSRILSEWNPTQLIAAENSAGHKQSVAPKCAIEDTLQAKTTSVLSDDIDEEQIIVSVNLLVHHAWITKVKEKAESTRIADLAPILITSPLAPYSFVSTNDA